MENGNVDIGNRRTVYVVYADKRKDMSDAERFGDLKDVFTSSVVGRRYDSDKLITYARNALAKWKNGDYLLMVGDPALCAICFAVALEYDMFGEVNVLRWNRDEYQYTPLSCNFNYNGYEDEGEEETAS